MEKFGLLWYGDDGSGRETVFISNLLADTNCERHECCGLYAEVNDVLLLEENFGDISAKKYELGCLSCRVGDIKQKDTSYNVIKRFKNRIVQVLRVFYPDETLCEEGEGFEDEVKIYNGMLEAVVIG